METTPWFKDWFNSPYYHQLYFKRDEAEAAKFINKLIDHLKPPAGSLMLDIACGKAGIHDNLHQKDLMLQVLIFHQTVSQKQKNMKLKICSFLCMI